MRAALFNGPLIPGGGPWHNGNHVPPAALPALVAAFNGGFEFRDITGGYMTEGRIVRPLEVDQATIGIGNDGSIHLGVFGQDILDDGSWQSLRQNLPPIVLDGRNALDRFPATNWGTNFHGVTITNRSALCTRSDGRLMYVYVGTVDIVGLTDALVAMGCRTAMQLDINGTWPQFATYTGLGSADRAGVLIDARMTNPDRYIRLSKKDFIAFFDPATLVAGTV